MTAPQVWQQVNPERGGRYYQTMDGQRFPSVTSILSCIGKPALINWAASEERKAVVETSADLYESIPLDAKRMARMAYVTTLTDRLSKAKAHDKIKQKAGDIGSAAHARVEWELRKLAGERPGPEPACGQESLWAYMAWEDWWKSAGLSPVWIEQMVYSTSHGYAGTMDLLARDKDNVQVLVDFKTSKAIYPEARLQASAYLHAINEMGFGPAARAIVVRLPKNPTDPAFEVQEVADPAHEMQVFLHVMELWKWQQKNDEAWLKAKEQAA